MTNPNPYLLDIKIDKLTDSIINRISGDSFRTEISLVTKSDLKTISRSKGWLFDWRYEFNQIVREVYKLKRNTEKAHTHNKVYKPLGDCLLRIIVCQIGFCL